MPGSETKGAKEAERERERELEFESEREGKGERERRQEVDGITCSWVAFKFESSLHLN